jgi:phage baseplate assembly protein W
MATLQFYYNYALRKSERSVYLASPVLWKTATKMYVMRDTYVFEENHINLDLTANVIAVNTLSSIKHVIAPGNASHIIEIGNTDFPLNIGTGGQKIGSLILANDTKPICIIRELEDFPIEVYGQYLTINFAKGFEKAFSFTEFTEKVGNTLIHQHYKGSLTKPINDISRRTDDLSLGELLDKSSLTGKSGVYKDISITGKAHPLTGDLVTVSGVNAINQSLRTIILANTYDRPFSSKDIAGNINSFLFEFADDITNIELKTGIGIAIGNNEPRISVIDIFTETIPESYALRVMIIYAIKTTNTTQEFTIILDRA